MAATVRARASLPDRVYARVIALSVHRVGNRDQAVDAVLDLARGDSHLMGRVRDRCEVTVLERPDSAPARAALDLATRAWIAAVEAHGDA